MFTVAPPPPPTHVGYMVIIGNQGHFGNLVTSEPCLYWVRNTLPLSLLHMLSHSYQKSIKNKAKKTHWLQTFLGSLPLSLSPSFSLYKSNPSIGYPLVYHPLCSLLWVKKNFHPLLLCSTLCFISWLLTLEFFQTKTITTKTMILTEWKFKQPLPKLWSLELFMLLWFKEAALQISGSLLLLLQLIHAMPLSSLLKTTLFSLLWVNILPMSSFLSFDSKSLELFLCVLCCWGTVNLLLLRSVFSLYHVVSVPNCIYRTSEGSIFIGLILV